MDSELRGLWWREICRLDDLDAVACGRWLEQVTLAGQPVQEPMLLPLLWSREPRVRREAERLLPSPTSRGRLTIATSVVDWASPTLRDEFQRSMTFVDFGQWDMAEAALAAVASRTAVTAFTSWDGPGAGVPVAALRCVVAAARSTAAAGRGDAAARRQFLVDAGQYFAAVQQGLDAVRSGGRSPAMAAFMGALSQVMTAASRPMSVAH